MYGRKKMGSNNVPHLCQASDAYNDTHLTGRLMIRLISSARLVGVDVEALLVTCCFGATFLLPPEHPQFPIFFDFYYKYYVIPYNLKVF